MIACNLGQIVSYDNGSRFALKLGVIVNPLIPQTHDHTLAHELRDALVICLVGVAVLVSACHRDQDARGPGERAGAAVDRAADKTKDVVKGGVDGVKNGAHKDDK
jgi:hypothetical protein